MTKPSLTITKLAGRIVIQASGAEGSQTVALLPKHAKDLRDTIDRLLGETA